MKNCHKCQKEIDTDGPIPWYGQEFEWSKVGMFYLCDECIEDILQNWMYGHLNNLGELING